MQKMEGTIFCLRAPRNLEIHTEAIFRKIDIKMKKLIKWVISLFKNPDMIIDAPILALLLLMSAFTGIYYAYDVSRKNAPWLFWLATLILIIVAMISVKKYISKQISGVDLAGNIIATGLLAYSSVVLTSAFL